MRVRKCMGCGFCCVKAPCDASLRLYNLTRPCPSLIWSDEDERHWCKLGLLQGPLGEQYRKELYMGEGCCSNLNTWRKEPLKDRTKVILDGIVLNPLPVIMQIFLKAMASDMFFNLEGATFIISKFCSMLLEEDYDSDTVEVYNKWVMHTLRQNRNSITKAFMG